MIRLSLKSINKSQFVEIEYQRDFTIRRRLFCEFLLEKIKKLFRDFQFRKNGIEFQNLFNLWIAIWKFRPLLLDVTNLDF